MPSFTAIESRYVPSIVLRPRPHSSKKAALLLVPLLEPPRQVSLPSEIWYRILEIAMSLPKEKETAMNADARRSLEVYRRNILLVCRGFKALASPLLYYAPYLPNFSTLKVFISHLLASEQKWDSLRRIPYSTPGRWVQRLNLSRVIPSTSLERLNLDALLTSLFPVTPFLSHLFLHDSVALSRRAITSLSEACGRLGHLRSLKGIRSLAPFPSFGSPQRYEDDQLTALVTTCVSLEELEVWGNRSSDGSDDEEDTKMNLIENDSSPLNLPKLRSLAIIDVTNSSLLQALLHAELPSLRYLSLTLYPTYTLFPAPTYEFLKRHGPSLSSLILFPAHMWPADPTPPPSDLLSLVPSIKSLTLSAPLPNLVAPSYPHPLLRISIPRPTMEFLSSLTNLPNLREVHLREVKHLRKGLPRGAATAGVHSVIKEWKRRLNSQRIRILDSQGFDAPL